MTTQTCTECKPSAGTHTSRDHKLAYRPATDVIESETGVNLVLDLPGVSQDQMDLIVEQDTLTVTGHRDFDIEGTAVYRESRTGEYRRVFSIGQDMDAEHITADLKDGVLRVHIPKAAKARPRRIDITGI